MGPIQWYWTYSAVWDLSSSLGPFQRYGLIQWYGTYRAIWDLYSKMGPIQWYGTHPAVWDLSSSLRPFHRYGTYPQYVFVRDPSFSYCSLEAANFGISPKNSEIICSSPFSERLFLKEKAMLG